MSRNKGGYAVRKVKTFRGREGNGFNAELCRDGVPVAYVMDDAHGGMYRWEWYDVAAGRVKIPASGVDGNTFERSVTPEEAKLLAHVASLPKEIWDGFGSELHAVSDESFVAGLLGDFENEKRLKRICKTKVLFRVKGDKDGEYRTIKSPYDDRVKAYLASKYGDTVEEVLNEKLGKVA